MDKNSTSKLLTIRFHVSSFWLFSSRTKQLPGVFCKLFAPLLVVCLHEPTNKVAGSLPVQEGVEPDLISFSAQLHPSTFRSCRQYLLCACIPLPQGWNGEHHLSIEDKCCKRDLLTAIHNLPCIIQAHCSVVVYAISRHIQVFLQYKANNMY